MKIPDEVEKLRDEEAKKWREQYTRPVFANGYEQAYEFGANWGFEQGMKHAVEMLNESYPKDNDGPYRSGGWFAEWLESEMGKMK